MRLHNMDSAYRREQYQILEKYALDPDEHGLDKEVIKAQTERMQVMEAKLQRLSEILEVQVESIA